MTPNADLVGRYEPCPDCYGQGCPRCDGAGIIFIADDEYHPETDPEFRGWPHRWAGRSLPPNDSSEAS